MYLFTDGQFYVLHLFVPIAKVSPLILSLVRLHNFCIDQIEFVSKDVPDKFCFNLIANVKISQKIGRVANADTVEFDELGRPVSLLG